MRLNNRTKLYGGVVAGLLLVYLGYIGIKKKEKETYKPCGACK